MPINAQLSSNGQELTLSIDGRFDFNLHREFREAVKASPGVHRCRVDLSGTSYLDSSALGMLLLLKDHAREVEIVGCSSEVRKVLEIANFHRIFTMAPA